MRSALQGATRCIQGSLTGQAMRNCCLLGSWKRNGAILFAVCILLVLYSYGHSLLAERRLRHIEAEMVELCRSKPTITDLQTRFGAPRILARAEVQVMLRRFAFRPKEAEEKASMYPSTAFFNLNADLTCFFYLDEQMRAVAFSLGGQ